jgi:hypothetical protein
MKMKSPSLEIAQTPAAQIETTLESQSEHGRRSGGLRLSSYAGNDIGQTTSVAPTDASKRQAILDRCTETDARRESQYLVFGAGELTADESVKLVLMSCRKWSFGTPTLSSEKLLGASSC